MINKFTHQGISLTHDGEKQAITKLTLVGGMITEYEAATVGGVSVTLDPPGESPVIIKRLVVVDGLITELEI